MKSENTLPLLIILDGPMGTGKTTVSKLLNEKIKDSARVGLDDVKKFIFNHEKKNSIGFEIGMVITNEFLRRGISVITESAFKQKHIESFIKIAKENNARFFIYQLSAPKDLLMKRVIERTKRLQKEGKLARKNLKEIKQHFESHHIFHLENKYNDATIFDSKNLSAEKIVKLILKDIKSN